MNAPQVLEVNVYCSDEARELAASAMFENGCQGLEELDVATGFAFPLQFRTFFESKEQAVVFRSGLIEALKQSNIACQVTIEPYQADWQSGWLTQLKPVMLAADLTLVPVAVAQSEERGTIPTTELWLEHAMAFGFGEHPTTRLAAHWLMANVGGRRVLDFGTGTGVLALVAARCGAIRALGVDVDARSIEVARRNADRNGLRDTCSFHDASGAIPVGEFDVIVANIDAATLIRLAPEMLKYLVKGKTRIALTGMLEEQAKDVVRGFKPFGIELELRDRDRDRVEGWVLLSASF